jgi:hypothetical protein
MLQTYGRVSSCARKHLGHSNVSISTCLFVSEPKSIQLSQIAFASHLVHITSVPPLRHPLHHCIYLSNDKVNVVENFTEPGVSFSPFEMYSNTPIELLLFFVAMLFFFGLLTKGGSYFCSVTCGAIAPVSVEGVLWVLFMLIDGKGLVGDEAKV